MPVPPRAPGPELSAVAPELSSVPPELSSVATALDELARRVTAIAEGLAHTGADWVAQDLFAVERSLNAARRRLGTLNERLNRG